MIRKAVENDCYTISKLIVNGWKNSYRGLIDDTLLDNMSYDDSLDRWQNTINNQDENMHIYVYEEDGKILGVIRFGKPESLNEKYNAEIHVLYVETSLKRHGIGTKLFNFAKDYFVKNNLNNMIIWCLKGNTPSINFYEKMGGKIVTSKSNIVRNINVEEVGLEYTLN